MRNFSLKGNKEAFVSPHKDAVFFSIRKARGEDHTNLYRQGATPVVCKQQHCTRTTKRFG